MKTYDCVTYSGLEKDLLEIRFEVLDKYVDYFVIVESDHDFAGNYKGFLFEPYKKFQHKTRYFKILDSEDYQIPEWAVNHSDSRKREYNLREQVKKGLQDAGQEDLILLCDVDEIPIIDDLDYKNDLFIFKQICFQGKLNLINPAYTPWDKHPKAIKFGKLGNCQELRMYTNHHMDYGNYRSLTTQLVDPGGWHFSYVLPESDIYKKIWSFINYRPETKLSIEEIKDKLIKRKDLFDGRYNYDNPGTDLVKCDLEQLPKYVQNNTNKFKHLLA